ncbi:MAG: transglutaminase domain-containing protein [Aequorivita sp.]
MLLCLCYSANAQIGSVIGKKENYKTKINKQKETPLSTERLAFSITRNAKSDFEKAKSIYKWIAENISYDNELMQSEKLQKQIYTSEDNVVRNVLEREKALCGGYALLFKYLCADVGIPAEAVNGFTKDYSGKSQKRKVPNHTWNAVKLNEKWQLLDITWAIGHGSTEMPDGFWFLTKPTDFIYTHYPEDSKWTLMENPISLSDFNKIH